MKKTDKEKRSIISDLKRFFALCGKSGIKLLVFAVLDGIISGAAGTICQAQALKYIILYFIEGRKDALPAAFVLIGISFIIGCFIRPVMNYYGNMITVRIAANVRNRIFDHLTSLPTEYFSNRHSGDVLARVNGDVDAFLEAGLTIWTFICTLIPAFMIIPYIFTLNTTLSVIILVIGLLFLILTAKVVDPLREKNRQIRKDISGMSVTATENITGFNVIRMFGLDQAFNKRFADSADALLKAQKKYGNLTAVIGFCNIFIWLGGESISAIAGILLVLKGSLNVADLSALVSVSSDIIHLFTDFSNLPTQLQKAFSGVDRIYELLDVRPEPERFDISGNVISEGIAVDDLDFSYTEGRQVLHDVSIHAEKGQTIALVGDSGSGKTTLVKILAGLYRAKDSKISLCGKPLSDYTLLELRKLIAYVPQDAYVFNGSIYENISYGRDDAGEQDIYEAARNADAEKFILEKPDGYKTQVGERGIQLSGGERQRLAIARAILKNSPVLLLDEATSSLDSESESAIQDTLDRLLRTHTSVVVAHRLSTIKNADRIYMMVKGRVIGSGKHEDLLMSCPEYRELYYRKFGQE